MNNKSFESLEESVLEFLGTLRSRPGLYFGETSLSRLQAYLNGYEAGLAACGKRLARQDQFHPFHDWVAAKLGFSSSTRGWCKMILDKTVDERQAFERFFDLLDEYQRERGFL
jgi:hypothetical protein